MQTPTDAAAALRMEYKAAEPPFAAFTGPAGRAWLVKGDDKPVGYIQTDGGPKTYEDLDAWQRDAEAAGLTTPESTPTAAQEPAQPADAPAATDAAATPAEPAQAPEEIPPADGPSEADNLPLLLPPTDEPAEPAAQDEGADPNENAESVRSGDTSPSGEPGGPGSLSLFDAEEKGKPNPFAGNGKKGPGVGSWVSWGSNVGRVDLIVTDGKVPGVEGDVEGTKDKPVARVVEWGDSGLTKTKHAVPVSKLKTTFPRSAKKDAGNLTVLVEEGARLGVEAKAIQTAYDRGHAAWPGYEKTPVKREAWAAGRAAHLIKAAADPNVPSNDRDLLTGVQA